MIEQTEVDIRHFDHSTFLAHRAIDAQTLPPPEPPAHLALPGAKAAVPHDYLLAYQEQGLAEHEIAQRVNARWERENSARLAEHKRWVAGPYAETIEQMRNAAMEEHAKQLRREAALERWMREHEEG